LRRVAKIANIRTSKKPQGFIMQSRHVVLARRPEKAPVAADFRVETRELPALADGRIMVEVIYATANPGSRGRLSGGAGYARGLNIGETMEGPAIGRVIESNNPDFAVGDLLWGLSGWAEHLQVSGRGLQKIPRDTKHLSAWAGILNIPGLTAYFGLRDVGAARAGETVLVSSAAGAVGAAAGQIARIMGCRVIGIASGDERRRWLRDEAKFDAVIDRRETPDIEQLTSRIAAVAPDGIDVYFDNVGGYVLDAAIGMMKQRGRIVICGQLADYSADPDRRYGTRRVHEFIGRRLRMEGLMVFDFADRYAKAHADLINWIERDELKYREHVVDGLGALPELFCAQLRGEIIGRPLARLINSK
jgi:NADPH-dependent curcumin reductase CurA